MEEARTFIDAYVKPTNDDEAEYLQRFAAGDYHPELLFSDESMAQAALASPEALWKLRNLKMMR